MCVGGCVFIRVCVYVEIALKFKAISFLRTQREDGLLCPSFPSPKIPAGDIDFRAATYIAEELISTRGQTHLPTDAV